MRSKEEVMKVLAAGRAKRMANLKKGTGKKVKKEKQCKCKKSKEITPRLIQNPDPGFKTK